MNKTSESKQLSDEELMVRYQEGDYQSFHTLYFRHHQRIYSYLTKRLKDRESIEEIHQSIFFKFHRCRHRYDKRYPLLKWLYTIARSELLDFCKKRRVQTSPLYEETTIDSSTESSNATEQIDLEQIDGLTTVEREALTMRYYTENDYQEISQKLQVSYPYARKLVSRGLKKVKQALVPSETKTSRD
ncbi:MAG: RNA polymerase sigma factor, partial [Bdellovibrionales bacterium]|nr:RNA polymerase sigma factor [Bdellovibrionales bacterium]